MWGFCLRKINVIIFSIFLIFIIFLSGCIQFGTDVDDKINQKNKLIFMSAKELNEDITRDLNWSDGFSLQYNSLDDGDQLVIKDFIDGIYFNEEFTYTKIRFEWNMDNDSNFFEIKIQGNINSSYNIGDEITISITIKEVKLIYNGFEFDMEIFKEQWVDEEFFKSDIDLGGDGFKPLPQSCISSV